MITIYTDGALKGDSDGRAISLIMRDSNFVNIMVKECKVRIPYEAELIAIINAFKYLNKAKIYGDVTIYTDAKSIKTVFEDLDGGNGIPKDLRYKRLWHSFFKARRQRKIVMYHIESHAREHNPNKVCDILGRLSYNTDIGG